MFYVKKQIVGNFVLFQNAKPAHHVVANDEFIVWFVLDDVTDTYELGVVLEFFDLRFAIGTCQINPADDAGNPIIGFRQTQDPAILFDVVLRLHKDCLVSGCRFPATSYRTDQVNDPKNDDANQQSCAASFSLHFWFLLGKLEPQLIRAYIDRVKLCRCFQEDIQRRTNCELAPESPELL